MAKLEMHCTKIIGTEHDGFFCIQNFDNLLRAAEIELHDVGGTSIALDAVVGIVVASVHDTSKNFSSMLAVMDKVSNNLYAVCQLPYQGVVS